MSQMNQGENYEQEIRNSQNQLRAKQEMFIRRCKHKPVNGRGRVINIHDYNSRPIQNKDKYSPSTVICTRCGAIFEAESFQPDEINSGIYMFTSMLHQIKMLAELTEDDDKGIDDAFDAIGKIADTIDYYNNMVDKLAGGNKGGGKTKGRSKGHIGLDQSMMGNNRRYN